MGVEAKEIPVTRKNYSGKIDVGVIILKYIYMGEIIFIKDTIQKPSKIIPPVPDLISANTARFFSVYPNPVSAGTNLNIEWRQTEEGYYLLDLIDQSGKSIHRQEVWIDAEARLLSIDIPVVAAGTYYLQITNKNSGKHFTEKIIIQ